MRLSFLLVFFIFCNFVHAGDDTTLMQLYQKTQKALKDKDLQSAKVYAGKLLAKGVSAFPNPLVYYDVSMQLIALEIEEGFLRDATAHIDALASKELPIQVDLALQFRRAHLIAKQDGASSGFKKLIQIKEKLPFSDWPQLEKLFHHTLSHTQNAHCDLLLTGADQAFKNKQFTTAWKGYFKLLALLDEGLYPKASNDPRLETHIRFYAGKTLAYMNEHGKAIDQYAILIDQLQSPSEALQIRYELGQSLVHLGQILSAKEHFAAVAKESSPSEPLYHRSRLMLAHAACETKEHAIADKALLELEEHHSLCTSQKVLQTAALFAIKLVRTEPSLKSAEKHLVFAEKELLKQPCTDHVAENLSLTWMEMGRRGKLIAHKLEELIKEHIFVDDRVSARVRFNLIQIEQEPKKVEAYLKVLAMPHLSKTEGAVQAFLWTGEHFMKENKPLLAEKYFALAEKNAPNKELKEKATAALQECLLQIYDN